MGMITVKINSVWFYTTTLWSVRDNELSNSLVSDIRRPWAPTVCTSGRDQLKANIEQ